MVLPMSRNCVSASIIAPTDQVEYWTSTAAARKHMFHTTIFLVTNQSRQYENGGEHQPEANAPDHFVSSLLLSKCTFDLWQVNRLIRPQCLKKGSKQDPINWQYFEDCHCCRLVANRGLRRRARKARPASLDQ